MDVLALVDGRGQLLQNSSTAGQRTGQTGQFTPTCTAGHKHTISSPSRVLGSEAANGSTATDDLKQSRVSSVVGWDNDMDQLRNHLQNMKCAKRRFEIHIDF